MEKKNIKYIVTKEQCQSEIDRLGGVCPGCGGKLEPFETVDNAGNPTHWKGCDTCSCFRHPVPEKVFNIAKAMVLEYYFEPYRHHKRPKDTTTWEYDYWFQSQAAGACNIVGQILQLNNELT